MLHFKTKKDEAILVRVGISGASAEGGAKNLRAECNTWDFNKIRTQAHAAWRTQLSKINIQTSNDAHKKVFYTALYHLSLGPTLFDDVDGQYRGMDNQVSFAPCRPAQLHQLLALGYLPRRAPRLHPDQRR